jgi:pimeloyl-ACP methyl ester carboxylesterase
MPSQTIILIPGLWRSYHYWHSFPDHLHRKTHQARIYCPDLPGFGERFEDISPLTIDDFIDDMRMSSWFRQAQRPCLLFGQSLGAMIALQWQHRFPDEILGCVLVNLSDRSSPWPFKRVNWRAIGPTFLHWGFPSSALVREQLRLRYTSNLSQFRSSIIHQRTTWLLSYPPSWLNIWRQFLAAASFNTTNIQGLRPLLYINSLSDRWMAPECTDLIASRIPGKRVFHTSAGHDLGLDEPAWLAQITASWLAELTSKA